MHQNDEILALIRNEVVTDAAGQRSWAGSFVSTNDRTLRDVAVTVDFLDSRDQTVGKAEAEAALRTSIADDGSGIPNDEVTSRSRSF